MLGVVERFISFLSTKVESEFNSQEDEKWWNVNVPQERWTSQCPDFLLGQCDKNIGILSCRDEDYILMSWEEAKYLVESKRIDLFGRTPKELWRYLEYIYNLKQRYGSILYYIQYERLKWSTIEPSGDDPFSNPADYEILYNDWPYALDADIKHLVVWTKFIVEEDPNTGRLTQKSTTMVENFIQRVFCRGEAERSQDGTITSRQEGVKREQLIWFKNWMQLRSVHALEHIHIMLYKAPPDFLRQVTQGDLPMSEKLAKRGERI